MFSLHSVNTLWACLTFDTSTISFYLMSLLFARNTKILKKMNMIVRRGFNNRLSFLSLLKSLMDFLCRRFGPTAVLEKKQFLHVTPHLWNRWWFCVMKLGHFRLVPFQIFSFYHAQNFTVFACVEYFQNSCRFSKFLYQEIYFKEHVVNRVHDKSRSFVGNFFFIFETRLWKSTKKFANNNTP